MISRTTGRFRDAYRRLPDHVRRRAREAYRRFKENPQHRSLRFKHVHATRPIYAARVGLGHRALGVVEGDVIVWFWIGTHAAYDRLLRTVRHRAKLPDAADRRSLRSPRRLIRSVGRFQ